MKKYRIILNPAAVRGVTKKFAPNIERILLKQQTPTNIGFAESPWHATGCQAQRAVACRYNIVVSVGGDGTTSEVLNELLIACDDELGDASPGVIPVG